MILTRRFHWSRSSCVVPIIAHVAFQRCSKHPNVIMQSQFSVTYLGWIHLHLWYILAVVAEGGSSVVIVIFWTGVVDAWSPHLLPPPVWTVEEVGPSVMLLLLFCSVIKEIPVSVEALLLLSPVSSADFLSLAIDSPEASASTPEEGTDAVSCARFSPVGLPVSSVRLSPVVPDVTSSPPAVPDVSSSSENVTASAALVSSTVNWVNSSVEAPVVTSSVRLEESVDCWIVVVQRRDEETKRMTRIFGNIIFYGFFFQLASRWDESCNNYFHLVGANI